MPKLTEILLAIEKNPMKKFNNYRSLYPYKQILPAALRNWVSGQGENKKSEKPIFPFQLFPNCFNSFDCKILLVVQEF